MRPFHISRLFSWMGGENFLLGMGVLDLRLALEHTAVLSLERGRDVPAARAQRTEDA